MKVFWRYAGATGEGHQFIINLDNRKEISRRHEASALRKVSELFQSAREEVALDNRIKKQTGKTLTEWVEHMKTENHKGKK